MGYSYSFADNRIYGTDDMNAAISRLTTSGVTVFPTDTNLIDAMNKATSEVTTSGVEFDLNSCKVGIREEKIYINPGTAFFEDGKCIVIDGEGEKLELVTGAYVYLFEDVHKNSCYPCVSKELPEEKCVALAYVSEDATVTDMRTYAQSKLVPNSPVVPKVYAVNFEYMATISPENVVAEFDAGFSSFTNAVFLSRDGSGYAVLKEGEFTEFYPFIYMDYIRFKKEGSKLKMYVKSGGDVETIYDRAFDVMLF